VSGFGHSFGYGRIYSETHFGRSLTYLLTNAILIAEASRMPAVRRQRDGKHLHRGDEVVSQSSDGEPRERSSDEGRQRVQVLTQQVQTIQQVITLSHTTAG